MALATFSVSEVRVAATCPRVSYFDAEHTRRNKLKTKSVTRLWKAGAEDTACGSLFHNAIESFNRLALEATEVREALAGDPEPRSLERRLRAYLNRYCVDLDALASRPPAQQQAFIRSVGLYMGELADIVGDALRRGKPADEILYQLFGDRRRRVDVTFQVGPEGEPIRVTGVLDYVFYDWRTARQRILDYKLTPAGEPSNDLFQVALYALMHHIQHRTEADVGLLYLHPERKMLEMSWDQVHGQRYKLFDLLASMAAWHRYDEKEGTGLKPPGEPSYCPLCKWDQNDQCLKRLGPKHEGNRLTHWAQAALGLQPKDEPAVGVRQIEGPARSWGNHAEPPSMPSAMPESSPLRTLESGSLKKSIVPPETTARTEPPLLPETGALCVGTTAQGALNVRFSLGVLPTHVAIVGAAGSGKTWMAKVVVEEAVRLGVPVLAVDPQGDLVQFLRPAPEGPGFSPVERKLRHEFLSRAEPRVWTPGSSHGRRLCLDPIRLAGREEIAQVSDPGRRQEEWEGLLAAAAAQLVALAKIGGETDSQQTFLFQVLRTLSAKGQTREVNLLTIAAAATDPAMVALDDPDQFIRKSDREKLARKLNGLRLGPSASLFTGGKHLDIDAMCRPDVPGRTPLNIVYLNALADDDQKHFFVAALAAEVYRWMVTSVEPVSGRPSPLFYVDEARDMIPAGNAKPAAKGPLIRLFTQGRKYGVACLICTQSPRSVDYNAFGNCSTKLIGRLESAQDLERVADWFKTEASVPPWLPNRKGAESGSFVGRWPGIAATLEGKAFRSRPLFSLHEGAWSPDRLERELAAAQPQQPTAP